MHKILEHKILGQEHADLTELGQEAMKMAERIAERGLCNVTEYYGTEVNVYYPGLYAGQTDLACVHNGSDAIVDFKQTNKPKQREWITDYFLQGAAYCMAHDAVYDTSIDKFVVMMCSPDPYYQEFIIQGSELKKYKYEWLRRLDQYHASKKIDS
jgi:genome maintenance exonuclease 1